MKPVTELLESEDLARVRKPLAQAWTLPPQAYTSADVFEAEVETIFSRGWLCVARSEQVANPGDYVSFDLPNQPIVVSRDRQGELQAFSRICLHRAMPVIEGDGNAARFTCPYHNWTYELDGRLRSAPMMEGVEGFDATTCRLPALQVEDWQGFIMVNLDPDAKALAPRLEGLSELVQNYDLGELVIAKTIEFDSPWNWKILVENFMEAYHHIGTHKDTFEPTYPARDSCVEDNDGEPWSFLRMPGKHEEGDESLPPLPGLTQAQQRELIAVTVFPTLLIAANANMVFWYHLEPRAHDQMQLKIHVLMRPEIRDLLSEDDLSGIGEAVGFIHVQDIEVNEGPWRGLHAPLTTQGRLSLYEKAIWQLNQLWADGLGLP